MKQDPLKVHPAAKDCKKPAIQYKIKDAKIRYLDISPAELDSPMCSVEYAFGQPYQKKTVFTFDGNAQLTMAYGREKMMRTISAAVLEFARSMSPKEPLP